MDKNRAKRNRQLGEQIIKSLKQRNMEGYYAETKEEALKIALDIIPKGASCAWGGAKSVAEIGLKDAVLEGDYKAYNREAAPNPQEKRAIELTSFDVDFFLTGTNALSMDGEMVNIDGFGNRVAAIAYGPRNVLVIAGMNKVVKTLEDAWKRARNEAAPINSQRFELSTPCNKTGMCYDCKSADTICCQFLVTRFSKVPNRIKVILVNDNLGF
ncbi:MAG: lactate utilization protein [Lachnospiraceae bacterium]|jgi:L-lactate utilization protein LutB|nr:lactate utilization protein [Lachnospiraceae bacterium]